MSSSDYERRILVTGGAGFVGSRMVLHLVKKYPNYQIVNYDKLDYCASLRLLDEVQSAPNYVFVKGDILDAELVTSTLKAYQIDSILHFAAQTHVDNSFGNSITFTRNNVLGTHVLLECARVLAILQRFIHVSTDEVYGESAFDSPAKENISTLLPTNPYAATKAGAEHLVLSYFKSYKFPVILTRSNNIYGPHQYPEKVIPKWICLLQRDKPCPLHGDGTHRRAYIYVDDVVEAYDLILHKGIVGDVYNISSPDEFTNSQLAETLIQHFGKDPSSYIQQVEDRAFNDHRYHIDGSKMEALHWQPKVSFSEGLRRTMIWYRDHDIKAIWGEETDKHALLPHPKSHNPSA